MEKLKQALLLLSDVFEGDEINITVEVSKSQQARIQEQLLEEYGQTGIVVTQPGSILPGAVRVIRFNLLGTIRLKVID